VYGNIQKLLGQKWGNIDIEDSSQYFPFPLVENNGTYGIQADDKTLFKGTIK
jgi:hypothetical protein